MAGAWDMRVPGTTRVTRPALPDFAEWTSYLISCTLHICTAQSSCTSAPLLLNLSSIVTRSRRHLLRAQVNKADGCRTNEQQKQQKQKQQKQQTQTSGGKNCVSSFSPDPASAASADGIEARLPTRDLTTHFPLATSSAHAPVLCA